MRTYTVDDQVFIGFNKNFKGPHRLVLVRDEDTLDVWAVDATVSKPRSDLSLAEAIQFAKEVMETPTEIERSIAELLSYFEYTESKAQIIGTYSEEGFRGFKITAKKFIAPESRFASTTELDDDPNHGDNPDPNADDDPNHGEKSN